MTKRLGFDVWYVDGIEVRPDDKVSLMFESTNSDRRQGVFVATDGLLRIAGTDARAFDLWADTAPRPVEIRCRESSSGMMVIHNIFERQPGQRMSQAHSSGMVIEALPDGGRRYCCCDAASDPVFDRVVFSVQRLA